MDNAANTTDLLAGLDIELLCQCFRRREASVGIVGLGYAGLPLALTAATEGFQTIGFDIDPYKMPSSVQLRYRRSRLPIGAERLSRPLSA